MCAKQRFSPHICSDIHLTHSFLQQQCHQCCWFCLPEQRRAPDNVNRSIYLTECNFTGNVENDAGGALGLFRWPVELDDTPVIVKMENCVISDNSIYHHFFGQRIFFGIGIIYTVGVHITFCGTTTITKNFGTQPY